MIDKYRLALRTALKQVRKKLSPNYIHKTSHAVCINIRKLESYRKAKHIALYMHANGEVNLDELWRVAPMHGKQCYFPVLNTDKTLSFLPATPKTPFKVNQYNILEPCVDRRCAIDLNQLDLVFFPLVGFDKNGNRLGMGQGYYDRTFGQTHAPLLIGVAYEFQQLDFIQSQDWDVALDAIITEKSIYWSNK